MIIFDEKKMPVIMRHFIGRWSRVVNVKLPEDGGQKTDDRCQMTEGRGQRAEDCNVWERPCPVLTRSMTILYCN
jgi:hypothetical protein